MLPEARVVEKEVDKDVALIHAVEIRGFVLQLSDTVSAQPGGGTEFHHQLYKEKQSGDSNGLGFLILET